MVRMAVDTNAGKHAPHIVSQSYRAEIDGLRALAVLPVVFFHAGFEIWRGGFVGVDIFFVISGYLITRIILTDLRNNSFSLFDFYRRRLNRLMPAFMFVISGCILLAWLQLYPDEMLSFTKSLLFAITFTSNIYFWHSGGYWDPSVELAPLMHTWSLSVEEHFYLIYPIIFLLVWRHRPKALPFAIGAIGVGSLIFAEWGSVNMPVVTFYTLPSRAWELAMGALVGLSEPVRPAARTLRSELPSAIGLGLVTGSFFLFTGSTPYPSLLTLIPTFGAVLIIRYATLDTFVGKMLSLRPLVSIGLLSYCLYLCHQPVFAFFKISAGQMLSLELKWLLTLVSVFLSWLIWNYVETPIRWWANTRIKFIIFLSLFSLFVLFGITSLATSGYTYPFRYKKSEVEIVESRLPMSQQYVVTRFNQYLRSTFDTNDTNNKLKILIIGDSYAQDIVNALFESNLAEGLQISTYYVNKDCGNLFLPKDLYGAAVLLKYRKACSAVAVPYDDPWLRGQIGVADEVWLISSWQEWQLPFINESVMNLEATTKKPVTVFGIKNFGQYDLRSLLLGSRNDRHVVSFAVSEQQQQIIGQMRTILNKENYFDLQSLICGSDISRCSPVTETGDLLSFDGGHLTAKGAKYIGNRLQQVQLFKGKTLR